MIYSLHYNFAGNTPFSLVGYIVRSVCGTMYNTCTCTCTCRCQTACGSLQSANTELEEALSSLRAEQHSHVQAVLQATEEVRVIILSCTLPLYLSLSLCTNTHTHTHTHARTPARTHTHAHTHTCIIILLLHLPLSFPRVASEC